MRVPPVVSMISVSVVRPPSSSSTLAVIVSVAISSTRVACSLSAGTGIILTWLASGRIKCLVMKGLLSHDPVYCIPSGVIQTMVWGMVSAFCS